jgi:hypothetical protein
MRSEEILRLCVPYQTVVTVSWKYAKALKKWEGHSLEGRTDLDLELGKMSYSF